MKGTDWLNQGGVNVGQMMLNMEREVNRSLSEAHGTNAALARRVQELEVALDAAQDDLGLMREAAHKRIVALEAERDDARAWAAAWRKAAKWWRQMALYCGRESQIMTWWHDQSRSRRADRRQARRAAEAMDAQKVDGHGIL